MASVASTYARAFADVVLEAHLDPERAAAGLRRIERDLDDPQTPKMRAEHLCFVTVRGDKR